MDEVYTVFDGWTGTVVVSGVTWHQADRIARHLNTVTQGLYGIRPSSKEDAE